MSRSPKSSVTLKYYDSLSKHDKNLIQEIDKICKKDNIQNVCIDLDEVLIIDDDGINILLAIKEKVENANKKLLILNVRVPVMLILNLKYMTRKFIFSSY